MYSRGTLVVHDIAKAGAIGVLAQCSAPLANILASEADGVQPRVHGAAAPALEQVGHPHSGAEPEWAKGLPGFVNGYSPQLGSKTFATLAEALAACKQVKAGG
jgi:hypothetical protein